MPAPVETEDIPVVRTDFSDPAAWAAVQDGLLDEEAHGLLAVVDDPAYAGMTAEQVVALLPAGHDHPMLVVADAAAMTTAEHEVLLVNLADPAEYEEGEERVGDLRCEAVHVGEIAANLDIANMFFEEYADAAAEDGVFRGF